MKIPFTSDQFFKIFENYNTKIFPFQIIILLLGFVALVLVHRKKSSFNYIGSFLGLLWIWIGLVYHLIFFSAINKLAYAFGILFILQGVLFLINALSKSPVQFEVDRGFKNFMGEFFIVFGLLIYPVIGYLVEGSFLRIISLGLPCPSTIATFGFLLLATGKVPKYLLIIPVLWSIVGLSAAINFGVIQDYMLIISAIFTLVILFKKRTL